jgi:CRP/FNR family transcriptional regulator
MPARNRKLKIADIKISCSNCGMSELCLPHGMSHEDMDELNKIVKRQQPFQPGQHIFRAGDAGHSLFALRSGALKSYCTTEDGDEQVVGFTMPGELVGLDGMGDGSYASSSVALETASVCELPYDSLEEMCHVLPGLNRQMMRVVSKEITEDHDMLLLLSKRNAEERLAAFLLSMSSRYHSRGLSATEFNLPMSRQDIGNYLGMAIETVSRLFANFQKSRLLTVNRRRIVLNDMSRLRAMVEGCASSKN